MGWLLARGCIYLVASLFVAIRLLRCVYFSCSLAIVLFSRLVCCLLVVLFYDLIWFDYGCLFVVGWLVGGFRIACWCCLLCSCFVL